MQTLPKANPETALAVGVMIAKLATHYYRPDFGPEQVKHMTRDFIEDLEEFPITDIENAFRDYRRDPNNKFFPTPGMIRGIALKARKDRAELNRYNNDLRPLWSDSRPCRWWDRPKRYWRAEWRESEIPADDRKAYEKLKARTP